MNKIIVNRTLLFVFCCLLWRCGSDEPESSGPGLLPEWEIAALNVNADGRDSVVRIHVSGEWNITGTAGWCTCSPLSGTGDAEITVGFTANDTEQPRTAVLILRSGSQEAKIQVVQKGVSANGPAFCSFDVVSPRPNGENIARYVKFAWKITAVDVQPAGYIISWSKDQQKWEHSERQTGLEYVTPVTLDPGTKYYWKVTAIAPGGERCESRIWTFFTGTAAYFGGQVIIYEENREENPLNVVFLGDGFDQKDYDNGTFDRVIREAIDGLFSREPFLTYRSYFNLYAIVAISSESGISDSDRGIKRNTAFGMTYGTSLDTHNPVTLASGPVYEYAKLLPQVNSIEETPVIVIGNESRSAGLTYIEIDGRSLSIVTRAGDGENFRNLVNHELGGHAIGRLGDEYVYYPGEQIPEAVRKRAETNIGLGWFGNLDLTSDKAAVRWKHFFGRPGYEEVGVYEGGCFYGKGIWKPTAGSCMSFELGAGFNAPGREAIVKRIMSAAKDGYTFEKFLQKDKK